MEHLIAEKKDRVGYITLNRPEVYNAVNLTMMCELEEAVSQLEENPESSVVVLRGGSSCSRPAI